MADDEAVLLHADSSAYFGLNQTGTLCWAQLAEHPMTLEELSAWAGSFFPDAPDDLQVEISRFIDELGELDLLESAESTDAASNPTGTTQNGGMRPPWEAPAVERYGELEKLILSGE